MGDTRLKAAIVKIDVPDNLWYSNMRGLHITVVKKTATTEGKYSIEGTCLQIPSKHITILESKK